MYDLVYMVDKMMLYCIKMPFIVSLSKRRDSYLLHFMYKRWNIDQYPDNRFIVADFQLTQYKSSILYDRIVMWNGFEKY